MARLAIEDVRLTEHFQAMCAEQGVPLPWQPGDNCDLIAANGETVCVVDVWSDLPLDQAQAILTLLVLAANTCGGFKAVQQ